MKDPFTYDEIVAEFPEDTPVQVTAADGRQFIAISQGDGVAWRDGHAWVHHTSYIGEDIDNCRSWEVAERWDHVALTRGEA